MASTIPAVLDRLVAVARLAVDDGVEVIDGQPVSGTQPDFIAIGFTGEPGEAVVEAALDREQLAFTPDRERYDVYCLASSLRGETDAQAVRTQVFKLIEALRGELRRDPTLDGLVMSAQLAVLTVTAEQTEDGALAEVRLAIRIDAFAG
ncbi:hypothetical protein [Microbispora sp. KK1-11]|uniref:hypothetical protein n=1 Tax=Microbispora sp. KK1-11 TaxID=2053005 RepID=UPI0011570D3D|nr:hypothetical protein [Microbispora sp. KK1-11]TQS29132.1 hypothetical protein FLW16_12360 [Microbispora sp. KK1-11]